MRTRFAFVKEVTVAFTTDPVYPSQNNARDLLAGLDPSPQKTWLRISARGSRFAHAAYTPQVRAGGISGSGRVDYRSKELRPTPPSVAVNFVGFALEDAAD